MSRRRNWGEYRLRVETDGDVVSWNYLPDDKYSRGGSVRVTVEKDGWVNVTTDQYEGNAMFPSAILPDVLRLLRGKGEVPPPAAPKDSSPDLQSFLGNQT